MGPVFKFEDVNVFGPKLTGATIPDSVGESDRFRSVAKVVEYDPDQCPLFLATSRQSQVGRPAEMREDLERTQLGHRMPPREVEVAALAADEGLMVLKMDPEQYEHHVAEVLRGEGWQATVSRLSRDLGVDVLATQDERRMAVQVKMYGASSSKVNAERIMCLHGAAAYAGCTERLLATDGQLTGEARLVADKLQVEVRQIPATAAADAPGLAGGFGALWREHIEPLAGTELARGNGRTVRILEVDGSGVLRLTSSGRRQRIELDIFRWTVDRLLAGETVTRAQIHERSSPRRVSSGVLLILGTVPAFELVTDGRNKALRPRAAVTAA